MARVTLNNVVLSVCLLFMAAGVANWGIFKYWVAVPFALVFIVKLVYQKSFKFIGLWLLVAAIFLPLLAYDHSRNKLLFPVLGRQASFSCDWVAVKYIDGYTSHEYYSLFNKGIDFQFSLYNDFQAENVIVESLEIPCEYLITHIAQHSLYCMHRQFQRVRSDLCHATLFSSRKA